MAPPAGAPTLTQDGVTLRAVGVGDEEGILEQARDPLTQRWTVLPPAAQRDHARRWLAGRHDGWANGTEYCFAIQADGRFAGVVGLRPHGCAGLKLWYGLAPWARGRDLTRRALMIALPWAFEALRPEIVLWTAIAGNWPGRRVAWSVGFRVEGTVRGLVEQRGVRLDGWLASLRRGEPLAPAHPWYRPPTLPGTQAALRAHRLDDVSAMTQACNDPQTQYWLAQMPRPYTRDDARAHLEEIAEEQAAGRAVFWALTDRVNDRLLGEIGLWGLAGGGSRSGELGYWTHPAGRGRHLTTEGVQLASRFALLPRELGGLGLARLVIRVAEGNGASQRVAVGAGFRLSGRDREAEVLRDGGVQDLLRFDLLAGEQR